MKKLLTLLSVLCLTLSGFAPRGLAQTVVPVEFYIYKPNAPSVELYRVIAQRNLTTYPYTAAKNNEFKAAVAKGTIARVTTDGCPVPSGPAPIAKPTCTSTGTGAPSWATGSWYDYNGTLFSVRATGADQLLKFERADGQAIALKNPDNIDINNTTFYDHATLSGNIYQWQVNWPNAPSVKLTYKNKSTSATYSKTFTPAVGANNVALFSATSTTVTQPPSTTTTQPPTSTVVTPTSGVYAYRGDDFDYTPYADADQSNKFPTFETGDIYVSLALRNQLQGATQPGLGGGVYQIKNKLSVNPSHVLVNVPNRYAGDDNSVVDRNRTPDFLGTGQGLGECLYQSPKPFYATGESGVTTSPGSNIPGTDPHLGYNPYELGDDFNNTGRLLKFGKSGSTGFYTAMGPMAYGQNRLYLGNEVLMEKWGQVSGRSLMLHYQTTFTRPNFSRALDKSQEAPCLYVPGNRRFLWYDGTSPYTGDGLTEIIATGSTSGNGGGLGLNGMRIGNVFPTENWIASVGENGYGVGLVFYDNIMTSYGYYGDGGADMTNPSSGGTFAYIGWNPQEVLDYNIKWRHRVKLVVGTVSEIRQEAYNDPYRPSTTPKFKFNRAGREGWIFNAGDDDNEKHTWDDGYTGSARAGWKVYFSGGGDYSASMTSPGGIWYANQFNKLYIRYKYSGSETQMELKFQRNRQKPNSTDVNYNPSGQKYGAEEQIRYANGGADQDGQTVKFSVNGDGQWHTAVIDFAGLPKWTGIISRFVINPHFYVGGKTYQVGESMTIDWINSENTDPFPEN